jgi:hypothetical protein
MGGQLLWIMPLDVEVITGEVGINGKPGIL